MQIDVKLRELWGLKPDDGIYVTQELVDLPQGQVIRELFPNGIPNSVLDDSDVKAIPAPAHEWEIESRQCHPHREVADGAPATATEGSNHERKIPPGFRRARSVELAGRDAQVWIAQHLEAQLKDRSAPSAQQWIKANSPIHVPLIQPD
jgi:hypothetical protein